jgi:hypothetical protein
VRFTVRFLGLDLIDICLSTEPECVELDEACSLDGGTTGGYPIGFSLSEPQPWDMDCPPHVTFPE